MGSAKVTVHVSPEQRSIVFQANRMSCMTLPQALLHLLFTLTRSATFAIATLPASTAARGSRT